ncbi:MAG: menaquinone biosynthesis protein [Candidatus Omnitrophota bacterium]|nr:menaquinone biosynthesis protein [Candidatus Omnitrophota bacterium]
MSTTTTTRLARVPYLNSAPFFRGLSLGARYEVTDCVPRALGQMAAAGTIDAGLLPLADYLRLQGAFERLGRFGIAVRGRGRSVLLFSRTPILQLDGRTIAVTEETSTSAVLLRLLLEHRYRLAPAAYERVRVPPPMAGVDEDVPTSKMEGPHGQDPAADAWLLIGDAALRFSHANTRFPYEYDLAFEWWMWQHLPCVFAVWAIRAGDSAHERKALEAALAKSLVMNLGQLETIAQESSERLGVPSTELQVYLERFVYRLGPDEEAAISRFATLAHEHHLL